MKNNLPVYLTAEALRGRYLRGCYNTDKLLLMCCSYEQAHSVFLGHF